jgi:radical SAM superfamily enzyme YgiQ (UPF0313 family)
MDIERKDISRDIKHVAIWGTGLTGKHCLKRLLEHGIEVIFFIDKCPPFKSEFMGRPVYSTEFIISQGLDKFDKIDAVFLAFATDKSGVRKQLEDIGFNRPIVDYVCGKDLGQMIIQRDTPFIYPIKIPPIKFLPNQDFILLQMPPRYQPMMPNGMGYVHNILKRTGIRFQTMDLNIIFYHRYHSQRILNKARKVISKHGYVMNEDPWDLIPISAGEWDKQEVIEFFRPELDEIVDGLIKAKPKIIGFSLNGINLEITKVVIKQLRTAFSDVIIIVGGYDCVYHNIGPRVFTDYDYMIIGEAELTLGPLVKALIKGERPNDLAGVISRYDSPARVWKDAPLLQDLDSIDFPRYDWIDIRLYRTFNGNELVPIMINRGCRWSRCRFCAECFPWRKRSPRMVVDEIEWFVEKGFYTFHFNDSDFNSDPDAVLEICDEIIRRRLEIGLFGQLRIHKRGSRKFFDKLRAAGFTALRFGVDAWTEHTIRLQNKGYTTKIIEENLRNCYEAGIRITTNLLIGVPGETEDDINETIDNILKNKDYIYLMDNINTLILAAGSEYWKNPEHYNIHFHGEKHIIYAEHPKAVPPRLWYSIDPYIDHEVRLNRLKTICAALDENGVNIGDFARWTVQKIENELNKAV